MKFYVGASLVLAILLVGFMVWRFGRGDKLKSEPISRVNQERVPTPKMGTEASKETTVSGQIREEEKMTTPKVNLVTSKGTVVLELFLNKAPNTVKNFLKKVTEGFYTGLTFHRVEDWVVQGGDPLGNGTGGGKMPTELNQEPFVKGSLGVARGAEIKVSNGSQFFICTKDCQWLTGQYTNFGRVVEGMATVEAIQVGDKIVETKVFEP